MKPTFSDLTEKQKATYGNGCGLSARFLNVPDFIFTADCRQHDFNYERGGNVFDKVKADWDFFTHMLDDAMCNDHWFFYGVVSVIYFVGVLLAPMSWWAFSYGKWRTIQQILERDRLSKV